MARTKQMARTASPAGMEALLDQAASLCQARSVRLTDIRRLALGLVLASDRPLGAYELLEQIRISRGRPVAPPTVYRALDFLLEQGLIHKIERLSAFVGCRHMLESGHACHGHVHAAQFLICSQCGRVTELDDPHIVRALLEVTRARGFSVRQTTIEAEGICAACA
ncbi:MULTISPECIES: Fur family transcriptional regulator [Komagataeibacter]|uniref:Ferric uptake regulation protein n=2 Tax=Acetobacteraceae TaxID=433 RepID=A0A347WAI5_9PROT|nr:Fur family transcriptional regulator [Komagataeibacter saccharivorans]AXY21878.1 Zinc uptake regulation protein [Komagataeibacter saccharivorans]QBL94191.1 Zinc uptake regulation protein [Komagataeibacter saccharivorans]GBQ35532.1 Fur family transcriptional regulator [Komagataeibacter saccharivorans NRIC 0614]